MKAILIELQFLPSISYFALLQRFDKIIFERHEHYVKQSYRNRCHINTPAGKSMIVVPLTAKHGKVMITDVRIDYREKWDVRAWRTLQSAYGKAPFFEHYSDELRAVLLQKFTFLYDLNFALLSLCLKWLGWQTPITESRQFEKQTLPPVTDFRNVIRNKNDHQQGKYYQPVIYHQVFGSKFVPDLSLLDLIYCTGPDASLIIRDSFPVR